MAIKNGAKHKQKGGEMKIIEIILWIIIVMVFLIMSYFQGRIDMAMVMLK